MPVDTNIEADKESINQNPTMTEDSVETDLKSKKEKSSASPEKTLLTTTVTAACSESCGRKRSQSESSSPSVQQDQKRARIPYSLRSRRTNSPSEEVTRRKKAVTPGSSEVKSGTTRQKINFRDPSLPPGVVDIYAKHPKTCCCPPKDEHDLQYRLSYDHFTHYGSDYAKQLREKERREFHERFNHAREAVEVDYNQPLLNQPFLTPKMRHILVHWLSEAAEEYKMSEASFHLGVTLLDIVLTKGPTRAEYDASVAANGGVAITDDEDNFLGGKFLIQRKEFQVVGCTCLWIASKMEDMKPPKSDDLVYIADYSFTTNKLISLENRICKMLQFRFHRVTPFHFMPIFLRASNTNILKHCHIYDSEALLRTMTLYLLEIIRSDYTMSFSPPSLVAAACLYMARAILGTREKKSSTDFWSATLVHYTGYEVGNMVPFILKIHHLLTAAESSQFGTTPSFNKFSSHKYLRVSQKTVPRIEDLGVDTDSTHEDLDLDDEEDYVVLI